MTYTNAKTPPVYDQKPPGCGGKEDESVRVLPAIKQTCGGLNELRGLLTDVTEQRGDGERVHLLIRHHQLILPTQQVQR
jgi:hypothetical protein